MRILFPCQSNPYFDSSANGNRNESLLNGLLKYNVEITILILGGYGSFNEFKKRGKKLNNSNLKIKYIIFTFQNYLWLRRLNTYIFSFLFNFFIIKKLNKEYAKSYDYIWITGNLQLRKSILNNLTKLNKRTKTFIELSEFQNLHKLEKINSKGYENKIQDEYSNVTIKLLKYIDCFAIMTKTLIVYYKELAQNQNAKFLHLPMTVDFDRFKNVSTTTIYKKPYIAFTGTYTNLKDGVDILIHSFGKIASDYPNYHLYLAGFYHGDMMSQKKIISELCLEDRITYLGELDKSIIPVFLSNAELLVLSRPDSKQAQGGFPTKLGEYLATGNPVCATTVGEIPDYLIDGESIFFAKPNLVESFADAMRRALSNKEEAKRIGENGKRIAQKYFNKDIQAKLLHNFLKENLEKEY